MIPGGPESFVCVLLELARLALIAIYLRSLLIFNYRKGETVEESYCMQNGMLLVLIYSLSLFHNMMSILDDESDPVNRC